MSIRIPVILVIPVLVYITVRIKKYGFKKWLKDYTDLYMWGVEMVNYKVTNINDLNKKIKKAQALSEELACVLKEINEFKAKVQVDERRIH